VDRLKKSGLIASKKAASGANLLHSVLPWVIVVMAFPVMCGINWAFLSVFPSDLAQANLTQANSAQANSESRMTGSSDLNPFAAENHLMQGAHIHAKRDPQKLFADFYLILGSQLAGRGQMIAAEGMLGEAVKMTPDNPAARMNYGVVLESLDKNELAMAQFEKAIALSPSSVQAYYNLGLLQDKMGNTQSGIDSLLKAQAIESANAMLNYDIGVLYAKINSYPNSAKYSLLAVENRKDFAEAYNNYGYALTHMGQYAKALEAIDRSLKLKPDSAATLDSKGYVYYGMGKYQDALAQYEAALKLDATIGEIYLHIAQAKEKLKQLDEARLNYEKYLELSPKALDRSEVESALARLKGTSAAQSPLSPEVSR
jgi:tetratricopeptide (TPR) repeat protein